MPMKKRNYAQERKTAIARGETGVGSKSKDATRHRARRKVEKSMGKKLSADQHVHHKKPLKSGGSNERGNLAVVSAKKNTSDGGKSGSSAGKSAGGKKGAAGRWKKDPRK